MKKPYHLLSLALATTAFADTLSIKEQLSEALNTESVARSPGEAAEMYSKIVGSFRSEGSPADQRVHAAAALFRLAEIRSEEGSKEEAEKLYREFVDNFPEQQPQVGIARKKLGIEGSVFQQKLTELGEEDSELSENVSRKRWNFTRNFRPDELLLTTFEVKHHEGYANKGLPPAFEVNTLHHAPSGQITEWLSHTQVHYTSDELKKMYEDNLEKGMDIYRGHDRRNFISGFGHSYIVPEGIHHSGGGWGDASIAFFFTDEYWVRNRENGSGEDERVGPENWLTVKLSFKCLKLDQARRMAMPLKLELPEMGDKAWSLTLPPSPVELEPAAGQDTEDQPPR